MKAGRPSSTALYIAKKLVFAAGDYAVRPLIPDIAVEMSHRYVMYGSRFGRQELRAFEWPWARLLAKVVERITIPGMTLHYVVRKRRIEEIARLSIQEGYSQIVVLGAGFDTLTQRLASDRSLNGITLIELDHPETQKVKMDVLRLHGLLNSRIDFLPCEFGVDSICNKLQSATSFSAGARTLFILEGLLMYLSPALVGDLLLEVSMASDQRSRVAFTFMEPQTWGRIGFGRQSLLVDGWLRLRGEPFRWSIRREDLPGYLAAQGFELLELTDTAAFRRLYLEPRGLAHLDLADGDHLCLAQVSGSHESDSPGERGSPGLSIEAY